MKVLSTEKYLEIIFHQHQIMFRLGYMLGYLGYYGLVCSLVGFIRYYFSAVFNRNIYRILLAAGVGFMLFVCFFPVHVFERSLLPFVVFTYICAAYVIYVLTRGIRQRIYGARTMLAGFLCLFLAGSFDIVYDLLALQGILVFNYVLPSGAFLFLFFESVILSSSYLRAVQEMNRLYNVIRRTGEEKIRMIARSIELTDKEAEYLLYLAKGYGKKQIMNMLNVKEATIVQNIGRIKLKYAGKYLEDPEIRERVKTVDIWEVLGKVLWMQ